MKKYVLFQFAIAIIILITMSVSISAEQGFSDSVSYTENADGFVFEIDVDNNGSVTTADRITFFVLYPGEDYTVISSRLLYFNTYACSEYENGITINYTIPEGVYGKLPIVLSRTTFRGEAEIIQYSYVNLDPDKKTEAIADFTSAGNVSSVKAALEKYTTGENTVIDSERIPEVFCENADEDILEKFIKVKDYRIDEIKSVNDVLVCLKTSVLWNALENNNKQFETLYNKYHDDLEGVLIPYADTERFLKIYSGLTKTVARNSSENFIKDFNLAAAISYIYKGSNAETVYTLEKNHEILFEASSVTLGYASEKNISLSDVAAKISKEDIEKYAGNFGDYFKIITDGLYNERISGSDNSISGDGGSGGGGGGGGGGGNVSISSNVTQAEVQTQKNPSEVFRDLEGYGWAKQHILALYNASIISFATDSAFNPAKNVTREEFLKMLVLAASLQEDTDSESLSFEDCTPDRWYYPYVKLAVDNGIVNGIGDNRFGAGLEISRQDMAVMCAKVLDLYGMIPKDANASFEDSNLISQYAADSVAAMSCLEIINGFENGEFRPHQTLTRAQAAVVISRIFDRLKG